MTEDYNDDEWTHDELRWQLARMFHGSGWDEPDMDAYDNCYGQEDNTEEN